jgi:DNA polymerase III epsilon subunit-like protein
MLTDCETSHLFDYSLAADAPGQPRLAQLGLIFVDHKYEIESKTEYLIRPEGWEMSAEATEKTGLTTEYLKEHGIPVAEALQLYRAGIEARRVVAGFNVQFDLKMMRAELRRAGFEDNYMQTRNLCLMWATRAIVNALDSRGKVKIPKLEEVCAFFDIQQRMAHRGLSDCEDVYQIMLKLVERGALPEPKSPYDKKPKKAKATRPTRSDRRRNPPIDDADQEMPKADFLGGASEDGK